jgi:hypothetical protein
MSSEGDESRVVPLSDISRRGVKNTDQPCIDFPEGGKGQKSWDRRQELPQGWGEEGPPTQAKSLRQDPCSLLFNMYIFFLVGKFHQPGQRRRG